MSIVSVSSARRGHPPARHWRYLWWSGLLTNCFSADPALNEQRGPPPKLSDGRVDGGKERCVGTLVKPNRVLTLESCVADASPEDLSFVDDDGRRHRIVAVAGDPGAFREFHEPVAGDSRALLTLSAPVSDAIEWQWDSTALGFTPVWLNAFVEPGDTRQWLSCTVGQNFDDALDCGDVVRRPGTVASLVRDDKAVAIGIDRGSERSMLHMSDVMSIPDRVTDVNVHVSTSFDRPSLQLYVADPEWNRIVDGKYGWSLEYETEFSPSSLTFFQRAEDWLCIAADSKGDVYLESSPWENLDAPVPLTRVRSVSVEGAVSVWGLGVDGVLCRKALAPERLGWRCGASVVDGRAFSALDIDAGEWVIVGTPRGVTAHSFADDVFGETVPWGLEGESISAVTLGRLQDRRAYALAATEEGEMWIRSSSSDGGWTHWSPFDAGSLPRPVNALHGGHVPGYPEQIYAVAAGRLWSTSQIAELSDQNDAGTPTAHFTNWR